MNVYTKLLKVQTELKAPKKRHNGFADYNYRSCEDILESAKPLLKEVGAVILLKDRVEEIAGRWYIVATAVFVDAANGERVEVEAAERNGVQLESILCRAGVTDLMQMSEKSYREEITKLQRRNKEASASAEGSGAGK